jgi:serine/threonine protein phosphatase 1
MLKLVERWKGRGSRKSSLPEGLRVYAIGDVHGCKNQMVELLRAIDEDRRGYAGRAHLVFLGDLVDRGPASAEVLEHLLTAKLPADEVTFLMGNHEELLLDCYDGKVRRYSPWLQFGGLETMASYGVSAEELGSYDLDLSEIMKRVVPHGHIAFVRSFQNTLRIGDFVFVHAGIRPGTALEHQTPSDLRWIRTGFLNDKTDHGFTVVHGHSIVPKIERRHSRIAVDTGCYRTGILSALVLDGAESSALFTDCNHETVSTSE